MYKYEEFCMKNFTLSNAHSRDIKKYYRSFLLPQSTKFPTPKTQFPTAGKLNIMQVLYFSVNELFSLLFAVYLSCEIKRVRGTRDAIYNIFLLFIHKSACAFCFSLGIMKSSTAGRIRVNQICTRRNLLLLSDKSFNKREGTSGRLLLLYLSPLILSCLTSYFVFSFTSFFLLVFVYIPAFSSSSCVCTCNGC